MTGTDTRKLFDHWVEQCVQQLEKGASANALADWMKQERVKAGMSEAVLETAKKKLAEMPGEDWGAVWRSWKPRFLESSSVNWSP